MTAETRKVGDEVFVLLQMMDNPNMIPVKGHVVWVTSAGAQGNKTPGVGVQFSEEDHGKTKSGIEEILAASIQSERPTQTM